MDYEYLRKLADEGGLVRERISPFFRDLMDAVPAAIYHTSYNQATDRWTIRYISRGVEPVLGYKSEDLENKVGFRDLLITNEQHYRLFKKLSPENPYFRLTFEFRDIEGQGKWVSDDGVILFDEKRRIRGAVGVFVDMTEQKKREHSIQEEYLRLKTSLKSPASLGGMVGQSQAMRDVFSRLLKLALSSAHLVVIGESGTGKELAARAIHDLSARASQGFVPVNCSSISESLFESEFFGHVKGSFTGAVADRPGFLDSADGGTLFLDEVGEIPLNMQTKLLRVLDGYGYMPVGGNQIRYSKFRLISATNRNLESLIRQGLMREDFYYRINGVSLLLPPLRERINDIPLLINYFLKRQNESGVELPPDFLKSLMSHSWPGNIRELQNVLSRYLAFQDTELRQDLSRDFRQVLPEPVPAETRPSPVPQIVGPADNNVDYERQRLLQILNDCGWDTREAAGRLNCDRSTVYRKMRKHGLLKKL